MATSSEARIRRSMKPHTMKIRVVVITDGKRWIAHGESGRSDSDSLQHMEVECAPQWQTHLDRDMICVVEAQVSYQPNRLQSHRGQVKKARS